MATEERLFDLPFVASVNVPAIVYGGNPAVYSSGGLPQFRAVVPDTATGNSRDIKGATVTTTPILGILQNSTVLPGGTTGSGGAIGPADAAQVRYFGISKVEAGGAVTTGAYVQSDGSGRAVTASAAGATNLYLMEIALTAATGAGDLIEVLLNPALMTQVNA